MTRRLTMSNEEFLKITKALGDSTRLKILQIISRRNSICACNILEELHITQGTLSHHMKVLADLKLVEVERDGRWCHYTLKRENICAVVDFIKGICLEKKDDIKACSCK